MPLFDDWCDCDQQETGRKLLLRFTEKDSGRDMIAEQLPTIVRSHYDDLERVANAILELGYPGAAAIMAERLPRSPRARSGELGEILATELVEEKLNYKVPIRRLRYKDGREMALRGDDFIGIRVDDDNELRFLKGESKSRAILAAGVIAEARAALSKDNGRPSATSLLFVADRLMDAGGANEELGKKIRNEVAFRAVPAERIGHALFALSGNPATEALSTDLHNAGIERWHAVVHLRIEDHQAFIQGSYEEALDLGNG